MIPYSHAAARRASQCGDESRLPELLRPVPKIPERAAVKNRLLTLAEVPNMVNDPVMMLLNNSHWSMPVTEKPVLGTVEIWTLINLERRRSPDPPAYGALQILDRRRFDAFAYLNSGELRYTDESRLRRHSKQDGRTRYARIRKWLRASLFVSRVSWGDTCGTAMCWSTRTTR